MARRSSGEGSIYRRQFDGKWAGAISIGGKRKVVYGNTRREVVEKLLRLRQQFGSGVLPDSGKRTVSDLLDAWLAAASPTLKIRTVHDYTKEVELHIRPALGHIRLNRLEPVHIQVFLASVQKRGQHRLAQRLYCRLHTIFKTAVLWNWIAENPCDRVLRPQYRAERKELWSRQELVAFLENTQNHWLYPLWVMLLSTGCRLGEALALTWDDVGPVTVIINKTLQRIAGQWVITEPKTKTATRTLVLPPEGIAALRRQKAQQAEWRLKAGASWQNRKLVFSGFLGQPLSHSTVSHALKRECRRLGIPEITPHSLRHLHASLLLSQGLPIPVVSQRLGHANPAVTMAIYAHALKTQDGEAARAISRALSGH